MTGETDVRTGGSITRWRIAGWSLGALLLLLPLVAMQFTTDVMWTAGDFLFAGLIICGVGFVFELTVSMSRNLAYRAAIGVVLAAAALIVWGNAAVGMIGSEDVPYNLLFLVVIGVALAGGVVARLRAAGMVYAAIAAAIVQVAVAAGGVSTDGRGTALSAGLAALWLIAAALFRKASRDEAVAGAATRS